MFYSPRVLSSLIHKACKACLLFSMMALAAFPATGAWAAFTNGQNADSVVGQSSMTAGALGVTASDLNTPMGVAIDPTTGKLFVAERYNSRVSRFASADAYATGQSAEAVLGQTSTSNQISSNRGGTTDVNTLSYPTNLAFDSSGRLWVLDRGNKRILRFDNASSKTNGADADGVLGQADFTSSVSARSQSQDDDWVGICVSANGALWAVSYEFSRALRFDNAAEKSNGANADGVLGQINYTDRSPNMDGASPAANTLAGPEGCATDSNGNLWIADYDNKRVLGYIDAANKSNGGDADIVLGQTSFTAAVSGATSATLLQAPHGVVVDENGALYVSDSVDERVVVFNDAINKSNGASADLVLGQADFDSGDPNRGGTVDADTMNDPHQLAYAGGLFVADMSNHRVIAFHAAPTVSTTSAESTAPTTVDAEGSVCGKDLTSTGVCWNTTGAPSLSDDCQAGGVTSGSFSIAVSSLLANTTYYLRAYATNSYGTGYGETQSFKTQDNDGVDDAIEGQVPSPGGGTGDGNGDGVDDNAQDNVTSLKNSDGDGYATVDCSGASGTTLESVSAQSASSAGAPSHITFPDGVLSFNVSGLSPGGSAEISIYVARDTGIDGYFKKNQTTGDWEEISASVDHTSASDKTKITFTLVDGGEYDADGAANGVIVDPGGPANIGTASALGLEFLVGFVALLGWCGVMLGRRGEGLLSKM